MIQFKWKLAKLQNKMEALEKQKDDRIGGNNFQSWLARRGKHLWKATKEVYHDVKKVIVVTIDVKDTVDDMVNKTADKVNTIWDKFAEPLIYAGVAIAGIAILVVIY